MRASTTATTRTEEPDVPIAYACPSSVAEAVALAAAGGRVLAGGQSLMPLVNRGDVADGTLVDINRIAGLDGVALTGGWLSIGALVRLEAARTHPLVLAHQPLLARALAWVANPAVRRRGTLVGNLVLNGPGAEAAAVAALAQAEFDILTPAGLVVAPLGAIPAGGLAIAVRLRPAPKGQRAGFYEVQKRFCHLGTVGAAVAIAPAGEVAVALSGLVDEPLVASCAAAQLTAGRASNGDLSPALANDLAGRQPRGDVHASPAYRRDVTPVVVRRAWLEARAA